MDATGNPLPCATPPDAFEGVFGGWNLGRGPRVMSTEVAKLSSQDENQALPAL